MCRETDKMGILKDIWKRMWPAALLLYISYFFYRWIGVYTSRLLGQIMDALLYRNGAFPARDLLMKLSLAFLFALLLMPSVDFLTNVLIFHKGLHYEAHVVDKLFRKTYEAFLVREPDEWMARTSNDSLRYRQMAVVTPTRLLADGTVLVVAVYTLFRSDIKLALLLTIGTVASVVLRYGFRKWDDRCLEATRAYQDMAKARQTEILRAHAFWMSYGCTAKLPEQMRQRFLRFYRETGRPEAARVAALDCIRKGLMLGLFLASLLYGLGLVDKGRISGGDFVAVYFLVLQVRTMAESLLSNFQALRGFGAQQKRMETLFTGIEDDGGTPGTPLSHKWECLSFQGLSYTYPGTQDGMPTSSFRLQCGESMNLEGENGSGKTTLLKLLAGLFPEKNDLILVDGIPLSQRNLADWRAGIGYVQQFPHIFPGTVRENVRIGNLAATQAQVDAVLEALGLSVLANRCLIGAGTELSGGEMKRVELARLMLRLEQCSLLMLDEPFENLDEEGQRFVRHLDCSGKARILVSHRQRGAEENAG